MPMDRRITIVIEAEGTRDSSGNYDPGPTTSHPAWATRRDRSQEDIQQEGGTADSTRHDWRVRWFPLLANTPASRASVIEDGVTFGVLNKAEVTGRPGQNVRRRFIDLQGIHTT